MIRRAFTIIGLATTLTVLSIAWTISREFRARNRSCSHKGRQDVFQGSGLKGSGRFHNNAATARSAQDHV